MRLACALSLLPFATDAPRHSDDGKVHGCFSRMPERRNPTESKCFVERRKQYASDEEFREDFNRTRQEKNSYHEVDHMKSKALMPACGLSLVLIIATAEPQSWRDESDLGTTNLEEPERNREAQFRSIDSEAVNFPGLGSPKSGR
jgi:hypothetical protein